MSSTVTVGGWDVGTPDHPTEEEIEARKAWLKAFAAFQASVEPPKKSKTADAGSYSYAYADLAEILEVVKKPLTSNGLAVWQDEFDSPESVMVVTYVGHEGGHIERFGPLSWPRSGTVQQVGSSISYLRRYAILGALGLAAEDDDGATAEKSAGAPGSPRRAAPVTPADPLPAPEDGKDIGTGSPSSGRRKHSLSVAACVEQGHPFELDNDGLCTGCGKKLAPSLGSQK